MSKISFWNNNHPLSQVSADLYMKVVEKAEKDGKIKGKKNEKLEKFRRASNAYYDIFNNGGFNRGALIRSIFGITRADFRIAELNYDHWDTIMDRTDPIMEEIVKEAALEQGMEF